MSSHHDRLILINKANTCKLEKLASILKAIEKVDKDIDNKLKMHQEYIQSLKISYKDSLLSLETIRKNFKTLS